MRKSLKFQYILLAEFHPTHLQEKEIFQLLYLHCIQGLRIGIDAHESFVSFLKYGLSSKGPKKTYMYQF